MSKCIKCKEYNHEKHYCPKWCDVIKDTIEDVRVDEREKVINEFKEKMRNLNQLNCFIDYVADEIDLEELMYYASEEIAEQLNEK